MLKNHFFYWLNPKPDGGAATKPNISFFHPITTNSIMLTTYPCPCHPSFHPLEHQVEHLEHPFPLVVPQQQWQECKSTKEIRIPWWIVHHTLGPHGLWIYLSQQIEMHGEKNFVYVPGGTACSFFFSLSCLTSVASSSNCFQHHISHTHTKIVVLCVSKPLWSILWQLGPRMGKHSP